MDDELLQTLLETFPGTRPAGGPGDPGQYHRRWVQGFGVPGELVDVPGGPGGRSAETLPGPR